MKLPWIKGEETKSVSSMMVALSQLGSARWGARSSEALMRDGYLRNAVVYRCIRMVAEAAASVPLVSAHAATADLLARPMPDEAGPSLLETLYSQLQMTGNAYVEAIRLEEEIAPKGLQMLRPERVKPLMDGRGWILGWTYTVDRRERRIMRDEEGWSPVLQLKCYHPASDVSGLAPLAAARQALDLHNASADWAKSLIDNSAKPSGALVYGRDGARLAAGTMAPSLSSKCLASRYRTRPRWRR